MKIKRFAPVLLVAPLALLAGCGGGSAAIEFTANWYSAPTHAHIESAREELAYEVKFIPAKDPGNLRFEYETGSYTATLQEGSTLVQYGVNAAGYIYTTEFSIKGSYYLGEEKTDFEDSIFSEVVFLSAAYDLCPVQSKKTYSVTSAYNGKVEKYNYTYTASYNDKLSKTTIEVKGLPSGDIEKTLKLSGSAPFLDNEQFLFALRAVDLGTAVSFRTVNPVTQKKTQIATFSQTESEQILSLEKNGTMTGEIKIPSYTFQFGYTDEQAGAQQTATYANSAAGFRNALLHLATSNAYGTFVYQLVSANFIDK